MRSTLSLLGACLLLGACAGGPTDDKPAESRPADTASCPGCETGQTDTGHSADTGETGHTGQQRGLSGVASVAPNPYNPLSALVTVTMDADAELVVAYGEGEALTHTTPAVSAHADQPTEVLVLGLRADRDFTLQVQASGTGTLAEDWQSEALSFRTDPLPEDWPVCTPTFHVDSAEFDADEVVCTNGSREDGGLMFMCLDRWGEPVLSLGTDDNDAMLSMGPLRAGGWVDASLTMDRLALFDDKGQEIASYDPAWLASRTRFTHEYMDSHGIYEVPAGDWAGALVFFTLTREWLDDGSFKIGNGVVVLDPNAEEVLYDYSFHGVSGDGVPMDPVLPYTRAGHGDYAQDWTHANSVLSGADADGRPYLLLSLRSQDWILKLYPDTDEIAWTLGFEGDFSLVDDLDAAAPAPASPLGWFYQQHGIRFLARADGRVRLLMFDNGYPRNDGDGYRDDLMYSRVVALDYDEETMQATVAWAWGEPAEGEEAPMFSDTCGSAELLPDDARVLALEGQSHRMLELSYPDGALRWELSCESVVWCSYRAQYFPDLYTLQWDDR